jgi:hypothetical protein
MIRRSLLAILTCAAVSAGVTSAASAEQVHWRFNSVAKIGKFKVQEVKGEPKVIAGPTGKALQFDGDDNVLIPNRPLVGAKTYTIEAIFRPEGGKPAQRVMHMAETDPVTGLDALPTGTSDPNGRWMFETRTTPEGMWYVDCFVNSKSGQKALINAKALHPINQWYAIQQTYDGKTYRCFVDGVLQSEGETAFTPFGPGRVRAGSRMNNLDYFTGSIAEARFTDRVLTEKQFLKVKK